MSITQNERGSAVSGPLLKRADVARMFGVIPETVREWVRAGKFPEPIRVGRMLFFRPDDVRRFLESKGME